METPVNKDKKIAVALATLLCLAVIIMNTVVLLALINLAGILFK